MNRLRIVDLGLLPSERLPSGRPCTRQGQRGVTGWRSRGGIGSCRQAGQTGRQGSARLGRARGVTVWQPMQRHGECSAGRQAPDPPASARPARPRAARSWRRQRRRRRAASRRSRLRRRSDRTRARSSRRSGWSGALRDTQTPPSRPSDAHRRPSRSGGRGGAEALPLARRPPAWSLAGRAGRGGRWTPQESREGRTPHPAARS